MTQLPNDVLVKIQNEIQWGKDRHAKFLEAWKKGIMLIGKEYFKIESTVESATERSQLEPNYKLINNCLTSISHGQALFLAAMYSFFNAADGQKFIEQLGYNSFCQASSRLDKEYVEVLTELFSNYSAW